MVNRGSPLSPCGAALPEGEPREQKIPLRLSLRGIPQVAVAIRFSCGNGA